MSIISATILILAALVAGAIIGFLIGSRYGYFLATKDMEEPGKRIKPEIKS